MSWQQMCQSSRNRIATTCAKDPTIQLPHIHSHRDPNMATTWRLVNLWLQRSVLEKGCNDKHLHRGARQMSLRQKSKARRCRARRGHWEINAKHHEHVLKCRIGLSFVGRARIQRQLGGVIIQCGIALQNAACAATSPSHTYGLIVSPY